jgi:hypothetical protein
LSSIAIAGIATAGSAQAAGDSVAANGPLAALAPLEGTWTGSGTGFSTTVTYRWLLPGRAMEAVNEP